MGSPDPKLVLRRPLRGGEKGREGRERRE